MPDNKYDKLIGFLERCERYVSNIDAKGIMALFMVNVRSERFCAGTIMEMIKSGAVKQWLLCLRELSQMQ